MSNANAIAARQRAEAFIRADDAAKLRQFRQALDGMLIETTKDVLFSFGDPIAASEPSLLIYKLPYPTALNIGGSVTFPDDGLPSSAATFNIERAAWNGTGWDAWQSLFSPPLTVAAGMPSNTTDSMWSTREVLRYDLFRAVCVDAGGGTNANVFLHLQLLTKLRER